MHIEPISQNSKRILDALRVLIEKGNTIHLKKNDDGWQYGGLEFNETVESLRQGMQNELANQGYHVNAPLLRKTKIKQTANELCRWSAVLCGVSLEVPIY